MVSIVEMQALGVKLPRWSMSVDEFHRIAETGIFRPDQRLELIEGGVVEMPAIGSPHAACVARLTQALSRFAGASAIVWVQNPVILNESTEVYPDVTLLRPRADFYRARLPRPEDVLLVVEVSDTTLRYDQSVKARLYARAGIPEFWIFDVTNGRMLTFREPGGEAYLQESSPGMDEAVALVRMPHVKLRPRDAFG